MEAETGKVLMRGHYVVDRKMHRISLTREGMMRVLALLGAPPIHLGSSGLLPERSYLLGPVVLTWLHICILRGYKHSLPDGCSAFLCS